MNLGQATCALCGGEWERGTTTFSVDLSFGVVLVRDVAALVCAQCGEAWIEDPVAAALEEIVADARRRRTVVEVVRWGQAAA